MILEGKLKLEQTIKFIDNAFCESILKITGKNFYEILPPVSRFDGGSNRNKKKNTVIDKLKKFF